MNGDFSYGNIICSFGSLGFLFDDMIEKEYEKPGNEIEIETTVS